MRALCDSPPPLPMSDLATRAKVDIRYASRVVEWLAREDRPPGFRPDFTLPFSCPLPTSKPGLGRLTAASYRSSVGADFIGLNSRSLTTTHRGRGWPPLPHAFSMTRQDRADGSTSPVVVTRECSRAFTSRPTYQRVDGLAGLAALLNTPSLKASAMSRYPPSPG